jgi:hypothetical protein
MKYIFTIFLQLGFGFGQSGSAWPTVETLTDGSTAALGLRALGLFGPGLVVRTIRGPGLGGGDAVIFETAGSDFDSGLAAVRSAGRPLTLTLTRAVGDAAAPADHSAGAAEDVAPGDSPGGTAQVSDGDGNGSGEVVEANASAASDGLLQQPPVIGAEVAAMLQQLRGLVSRWARAAGVESGSGEVVAHLYLYGSCALMGAADADGAGDSDVDVLVVVPDRISRDRHFFGPVAAGGAEPPPREWVLVEALLEDGRVEQLSAVTEAYVPCIRLEFCGHQLDLTFASLPGDCLPKDELAQQLLSPAVSLALPAGMVSAAVLAELSQRQGPGTQLEAWGGGGGGGEGRQTLRCLNAVRTVEAHTL